MPLPQTIYTSLRRELRVYPNVVEVWEDGCKVIAFTTDEWARMVIDVGLRAV